MSKLKPCPFCGSKAELIKGRFSKATWFVGCSDCSTMVTSKEGKSTKKKAVEAWNTRVEPSWCERGLAIVMHEAGGGGSDRSHLKQQLKDELISVYRDYFSVGINCPSELASKLMFETWNKIQTLEAKLKEANDTAPSSALTNSQDVKR